MSALPHPLDPVEQAKTEERAARTAWEQAAERRMDALITGKGVAVAVALYQTECAAYARWCKATEILEDLAQKGLL